MIEPRLHLAAALIHTREIKNMLQHLPEPSSVDLEVAHFEESDKRRVMAGRWTNEKYSWLHETHLHRAAAMGNWHAVKAILQLDKILDINALDVQDRTPLWQAAAAGSWKIVGLLLKHGANTNARDKRWKTSLDAACVGGHLGTVHFLLRAGAKPTYPVIQITCLTGYDSILQAILRQGAKAELDTDTALHIAAANGRFDCVKSLCAFGCDTGVRDMEIYRKKDSPEEVHVDNCPTDPLGFAIRYGHGDIAEYLLRRDNRKAFLNNVKSCLGLLAWSSVLWTSEKQHAISGHVIKQVMRARTFQPWHVCDKMVTFDGAKSNCKQFTRFEDGSYGYGKGCNDSKTTAREPDLNIVLRDQSRSYGNQKTSEYYGNWRTSYHYGNRRTTYYYGSVAIVKNSRLQTTRI
ncbi:hypothetical protein PG994_002268 [Apiospora phragmitis]|uniref:Uncharacterized protein n=1 Tax=Apiospora phragmitis TaxID=2905665 RepID=A0ABR1WVV2_9PEZI